MELEGRGGEGEVGASCEGGIVGELGGEMGLEWVRGWVGVYIPSFWQKVQLQRVAVRLPSALRVTVAV